MDKSLCEKIFNREYSCQRNLFTPYVVDYVVRDRSVDSDDKYIVEISYGDGIVSKWMVGITVLEVSWCGETTRRYDLSKGISGENKADLIEHARRYISELS